MIHAQLSKARSVIWLHAHNLQFTQVTIRQGHAVIRPVVTYDIERKLARLQSDRKLGRGKLTIRIEYTGSVREDMNGLFISRDKVAGRTKRMLVTQCQSVYARTILPCLDAPGFKAVFALNLIIPEKLNAYSNGAKLSNRNIGSGKRQIVFKPTRRILPEVFGFQVGEFEVIKAKTRRGTVIQVVTARGKSRYAKFGLGVAVNVLQFLEQYFGYNYQSTHLTLAVVRNFEAAAMENDGWIVFWEGAFLYDPKRSSIATKRSVVCFVVHELVHQWLGNTVTMKERRFLWIQEGITTWLEYYIGHLLYPQLGIMRAFVQEVWANAVANTAVLATRAIETQSRNCQDAAWLYDSVVYSKGAVVVASMIFQLMGPANFQKGLQVVVSKYAGRDITSDQLIAVLQRYCKYPLRMLLKKWLRGEGFALITAQPEKDGRVLLEQSRFFRVSEAVAAEERAVTKPWLIPLGLMTPEGGITNSKHVLRRLKTLIPFNEDDLPVINVGMLSGCRVNYPVGYWYKIADAIRAGRLEKYPDIRYTLLLDLYALMRAGEVTADVFLDFLEAYRNERDNEVLCQMVCHAEGLEDLLESENFAEALRAHFRGIFQPISKEFGWEKLRGESESDSELRPVLISCLAALGDEKIKTEGLRRFRSAHRINGRAIPPSMRAVLNQIAGHYDGRRAFWALVQDYKKARSVEQKDDCLTGLCAMRDPALIEHVLNWALEGNLEISEWEEFIIGISNTTEGLNVLWPWLQQNWEQVRALWPNTATTEAFIFDALEGFQTFRRAREVEQFFSSKSTTPLSRLALDEALELIRGTAFWHKRARVEVRRWLKAHKALKAA